MGSLQINNIKLEKAKAITKHRQVHKLANFFRLIEICVLLIVVSKVFVQLPLAVKISSEYFKNASISLFGPGFVFIIGNAIVITLFVQFSSKYSTKDSPVDHIYEEFVEKSEKAHNLHCYEAQNRGKQSTSAQAIVTASETKKNNYRRSKSENFKRPSSKKSSKELKRLATEKFEKSCHSGEKLVNLSYPEDNMSNEEFRQTVEAFIKRQQKFRQEEEYFDT